MTHHTKPFHILITPQIMHTKVVSVNLKGKERERGRRVLVTRTGHTKKGGGHRSGKGSNHI